MREKKKHLFSPLSAQFLRMGNISMYMLSLPIRLLDKLS